MDENSWKSWPKALLEGPSFPAPPGTTSNLINPTDLANTGYAVVAISIFLATIILALRFYSKITITKSCSSDDYVLLVGWALFIAFGAELAVEFKLGTGRHMWDIQLKHAVNILKHIYLNAILYTTVTAVIKVSIFLQFLRILNPTKRRGYMFWGSWVSIVLFSAFYFGILMAACFICRPVAKFWVPWMQGTCGVRTSVPIISSAANIVSDIVIIVLPQRTIWKLNMSTKQKMKVSTIFFLGLFALAASLCRLYYTMLLVKSQDYTWYITKMGLWGLAEIVTTIACSCVPSLHGLFTRWKSSSSMAAKQTYGSRSAHHYKSASESHHREVDPNYQEYQSLQDLYHTRDVLGQSWLSNAKQPIVREHDGFI